jgi:ABC-type nitrate/sulfonate/bicarbonate transport system ATPase subunit
MSDALITIKSLSYCPAESPEDAILRDVTFTIHDRERLAIIGANGCGKTTLLRLISGDNHMNGIATGGIDRNERLTSRHGSIGFVRQRPMLFPWLRIRDNIAFGIARNSANNATVEQRTIEQMRRFRCEPLQRKYPFQLSGGEMQRVALAQALITRPALLLLDEPFSAMDVPNKSAMIDLLSDLSREQGFGIAFVSHDYRDVIRFADRVLVLLRGVRRASIFREFVIPPQKREDQPFLKEMLWALSEAANSNFDGVTHA